MKKLLFLIRGLPGSGKSTLGEYLVDGTPYLHIETDQFFVKDGEYHFDGSRLKEAHEWCRVQVEADMFSHLETFEGNTPNSIIVSNTFTQDWELQPYYDLALKYGYKVISLICENRHEGKNTHNVPEPVIEKMKNRFQVKL